MTRPLRTVAVVMLANLLLLLAACRGAEEQIDAAVTDESSAVIGEQRVAAAADSAAQSPIEAAGDPMALVDFRQAYTIELGRFDDEAAALAFGRALPLEQAEMGVACQVASGGRYFLLGYGLYLGADQAGRVVSLLRQRADLYLPAPPTLRRLDQVQASAAEPPCGL